MVQDLGQDGLHLRLAAGHDLAQQVAGVPVDEDAPEIEDDGVHASDATGSGERRTPGAGEGGPRETRA